MKRFQELKQRAALVLRILRGRDGTLVRHTINELTARGSFDDGGPESWIAHNVVDLVRVFSTQGHSGFSAPYAIGMFKQAASFEPLGPLTGDGSEWADMSDMSGEPMWQNRRCSHVFKGADGRAYDLNAVIFEEPNGGRFTGLHSRRFINFPYSPRSVVAQLPADATDAQRAMLADQAWDAA